MMEDQILNILRRLQRPVTALQLAKQLTTPASSVSRSDVNRTLYSLQKNGAVSMAPGTPPLWSVHDGFGTPPTSSRFQAAPSSIAASHPTPHRAEQSANSSLLYTSNQWQQPDPVFVAPSERITEVADTEKSAKKLRADPSLPLVFLDLDNSANILAIVEKSGAEILSFAESTYNGPSPLSGDIIHARGVSKDAADIALAFHCGEMMGRGKLKGRRVFIISGDKSLANLVEELRGKGIVATFLTPPAIQRLGGLEEE